MSHAEIDSKFCKGCELCVDICPKDCLAFSGKTNAGGYDYVQFKEGSPCIGCALCRVVCPDCAITVYKG